MAIGALLFCGYLGCSEMEGREKLSCRWFSRLAGVVFRPPGEGPISGGLDG